MSSEDRALGHREGVHESPTPSEPACNTMAGPVIPDRPVSAKGLVDEDRHMSHDEQHGAHSTDDVQKQKWRSVDRASRGPSVGRSEASAQVTELSESEVELEDIQPADDDSDFVAEGSPQESLRSDSGFEDDDSQDSRPRKRKGKALPKKRKERTPPDNEQTRKLRNRVEEPEAEEGTKDKDGEDSDLDLDDDKPRVLERHVTLAQEEEQQAELQSMWEMAVVLDFLRVFSRDIPSIANMEWTANGLESALITSTGGPGLLASIHMELLRPMLPRGATMTVENWTVYFANLLRRHARDHYIPGDPAFAPPRGDEAITYANLPTEDRVLALKALCEARIDRGLHQVVDDAIKPPRPPKGAKEHGGRGSRAPPPRTLEDFRLKPLGRDSSGFLFYWLDLGPAGSRLYKETPHRLISKTVKAAQVKKGRVGETAWELQASTVEELQALGEKVRRSRDRNDQKLATELLDFIVPQLAARVAEEERKAKAAARLRLQLSTIIPDADGGFGRPRRARKEVNYTFENYDNMIRSAMRSEKPGRDRAENGRSRRGASPPRPTAEEEARAGLRRGRSAAAVVRPEEDEDEPPTGSTPEESDQHHADPASDDGGWDEDGGEDPVNMSSMAVPLSASKPGPSWEQGRMGGNGVPVDQLGAYAPQPPALQLQKPYQTFPSERMWPDFEGQAGHQFSGLLMPQPHNERPPQANQDTAGPSALHWS
eukprot:jgi/Botrbrau1/9985/Bobra.0012s0075.2